MVVLTLNAFLVICKWLILREKKKKNTWVVFQKWCIIRYIHTPFHTRPEKFEDETFAQETHQKFSFRPWRRPLRKAPSSKSFSSTLKRKAGVLKFLQFEKRFRKAPFSVENLSGFRNFSSIALMEPEWRSCLECTKRSSIHAIKKIQLSVYSQPNLNVNCIYCRIRLTILFVVFPLACNCNPEGSLNVSCNEYGECNCKFGVLGIKCDSCEENKHNLTAGCVSKYCCSTDTIFFGRLFCPFTVLLFIWRTSKALGEGRLLEL